MKALLIINKSFKERIWTQSPRSISHFVNNSAKEPPPMLFAHYTITFIRTSACTQRRSRIVSSINGSFPTHPFLPLVKGCFQTLFSKVTNSRPQKMHPKIYDPLTRSGGFSNKATKNLRRSRLCLFKTLSEGKKDDILVWNSFEKAFTTSLYFYTASAFCLANDCQLMPQIWIVIFTDCYQERTSVNFLNVKRRPFERG